MKNLGKIGNGARVAALTVALAIAAPAELLSQTVTGQEGKQFLADVNSGLKNIMTDLTALLRTIMGIGAIVMLVVVVYQLAKGEREAAEKLGKWAAALVLGFVLMAIVNKLIG